MAVSVAGSRTIRRASRRDLGLETAGLALEPGSRKHLPGKPAGFVYTRGREPGAFLPAAASVTIPWASRASRGHHLYEPELARTSQCYDRGRAYKAHIPATARSMSTSPREPTMMYRYSPRFERIHQQTQFVRREGAAHEQGTAPGLDLAEGRDHTADVRAPRVRFVVHLETADLLDLQEQVIEKHRVAVQVDKVLAKRPATTRSTGWRNSRYSRGESTPEASSKADDGTRRPQLVLGIEAAAVIQRNAFPVSSAIWRNTAPTPPQQPPHLVGGFEQVHDALRVAPQQGRDVGRAEGGRRGSPGSFRPHGALTLR